MPSEPQALSLHPRLARLVARWREFCDQWRHCYLLFVALYWGIWRGTLLAVPRLDGIRVMGGLHPVDVLLLMRFLELMWIPPLVAALIYGCSFAVPRLNTVQAIAFSALVSTTVLTLLVALLLLRISLS